MTTLAAPIKRRAAGQGPQVVQLVQVVGITGKVNNYAQLNARSEMRHAHALWAKRVTLSPSPLISIPLIQPAVAIAPVAPIGRQRVKVYALCCIHMAFLQRASRRVAQPQRSALQLSPFTVTVAHTHTHTHISNGQQRQRHMQTQTQRQCGVWNAEFIASVSIG